MPRIIPVKDLKNTGAISQMCEEVNEPVFITKNGYGAMVIMSMQLYEQGMYMQDVYNKLERAELDVAEGRISDAKAALKRTREKYNV